MGSAIRGIAPGREAIQDCVEGKEHAGRFVNSMFNHLRRAENVAN
jgi:hypothetical protein